MGEVIFLDDYRARRTPLPEAMERLELAVRRLEPLVRSRADRLSRIMERELATIADEVWAGRPRTAARLAERLADRLEHPAALG